VNGGRFTGQQCSERSRSTAGTRQRWGHVWHEESTKTEHMPQQSAQTAETQKVGVPTTKHNNNRLQGTS